MEMQNMSQKYPARGQENAPSAEVSIGSPVPCTAFFGFGFKTVIIQVKLAHTGARFSLWIILKLKGTFYSKNSGPL
jgi:hypothetical protein